MQTCKPFRINSIYIRTRVKEHFYGFKMIKPTGQMKSSNLFGVCDVRRNSIFEKLTQHFGVVLLQIFGNERFMFVPYERLHISMLGFWICSSLTLVEPDTKAETNVPLLGAQCQSILAKHI
eukprot:m.37637 g.37637  ORF g.37637 m.37637 type:complete len:121 (+) comp16296_c0_seq2:458-820(+)